MKNLLIIFQFALFVSCANPGGNFDIQEYTHYYFSKDTVLNKYMSQLEKIEVYKNGTLNSDHIYKYINKHEIHYIINAKSGKKNINHKLFLSDDQVHIKYLIDDSEVHLEHIYFFENNLIKSKITKTYNTLSEEREVYIKQDDYYYIDGKIDRIDFLKIEKDGSKIHYRTKNYIYEDNVLNKIIYYDILSEKHYEEKIYITNNGYIATPSYYDYFGESRKKYEKKVYSVVRKGNSLEITEEYFHKGKLYQFFIQKREADRIVERIVHYSFQEKRYVYYYAK